jgi:N-sulfoglucosamine sulfohydrolase
MKDLLSPSLSRRRFLALAGASALVRTRGQAVAAAESDRPNILWITAEDMSPTLGCYGDAYATTPNIDALAAQSVRYTNAFATAPVCSPARSCLITGLYATSMGTANLRSQFPLPTGVSGFPSYLRKAGYYCTNNVKTDYNTSNAGSLVRDSWNACSAEAHWRGKKKNQPFFAVFNDMTTHQSRSMVWPYKKFQTEIQSKLGTSERHDPAKAPLPPYYPDTPVTRRTLARYYDCITVMDKNTGKLLKQLEEDGLADNTIVFFYSDHGAGLPRHKRLVLDSGLRVALMVRFPEKYKHLAPANPGEGLDRLVSFVDFAPTVLSLLGMPIPEYMQGRPFLGRSPASPRTHIYGARDRVDEAYDLARCVRDRNWLYIRNYMPHISYNQPSFYSDQGEIRDDITRLEAEGQLTSQSQRHYAGPVRATEELYDTANDPHQVSNLATAAEHEARLERMRALLRQWILDTRDLGFLPECDMAARMGTGTPRETLRSDDAYPLERILAAAERVGTGAGSLPMQVEMLNDKDAAVRYWAAVGLHALGKDARSARAPLTVALKDTAPAVRIEAAWAFVDMGFGAKALPVLAAALEGRDRRAAVRAARALEMLGEKARPMLPAMQRARAAARKGRGDGAMFIRFALDTALEKLGQK